MEDPLLNLFLVKNALGIDGVNQNEEHLFFNVSIKLEGIKTTQPSDSRKEG